MKADQGWPHTKRMFRGFTLLELLVVMTLLSLVMLALGGALRGMAQTEERVDARLEKADEFRVAVSFIRSTLGRASTRKLEGTPANPAPLPFVAAPHTLMWVGVMPPRYGAGGRHFFLLEQDKAALNANASGASPLVIRFAPWVADTNFPDQSSMVSHQLMANVLSVDVRYQDIQSLALPWRQDWPFKDRLPAAISLSIQTAAGALPELVIAVRALTGADDEGGLFVTGGGAR